MDDATQGDLSVALAATCLGLFGLTGCAGGQEVTDLSEVIRTNADRMLQGPAGDPQATMANLVGAVSRLAKDGSLPAPFRERVDSATAVMQRGRFLDDRVLTELQAAYEALSGGRKFAVGGSLAVTLYLGRGSASVAIGWAGTVAALLGLAEAGHGFATSSIELIAGGLTFMLCACFVSLVVMAAVGFPLHDHAALGSDTAGRWGRASRFAWWGLPLVCLLALAVTIVLVMVPMTAKAG